MKRGALLCLGLLAFVGFAVAKAPATHLYGWLAPEGAWPRASGIRGTVSEGAVKRLLLNTQGGAIGDMSWDLQAWKLLLARASYRIHGGDDGLLIDGIAAALPSGTVLTQDLRMSAPLTRLAAAGGYPFIPATATIGMHIEHAKFRNGWPVAAEGSINVNSLVWKLGKNAVKLGDYQVQFSEDSGAILGLISTQRGPLQVEGQASAKPDRSWGLELKLKPEASAPREVVNLARSIGQPDSQGWYHIQQQSPVRPPSP